MDTKLSTNRKFKRVFANILSIFVILVMVFPVTGSAYAQESTPFSGRDEFNGSLAEGWEWTNENPDKWSLTENEGFLRIFTAPNGTGSENLLLRPVAQGDFMIKTRMLFEPDTNFQFAGLVIWQDDQNFLQLGRAFCDVEDSCVGNGIYFDNILGGEFADGNFATPVDSPNEAYLRLERRGDIVRAFFSYEGITWFEIGTHWIPPDFQANAVGLTASQDLYTPDWDIPADFDFFELTEGWGFLPEGFHDFDSGDFPNWVCDEGIGVGGWAADPDDRTTDLAIEVNIDGESLPDWLYASEYREDLDNAGVCVDGNCSFSTSLTGPYTLYEPHFVVVYAQDIPSGEWVQLSSSPKTFTCRTNDIYTFDSSTGTTKQITNMPDKQEYNPRWSPDGTKIVHDAWSTDWSSHAVYITDVKSGVSTPLAGAESGSYPTWSPNDKWIAFDRGADNDYSILIVPPTGGVANLVSEDAFMASWSPDSKRLAFHQPSDGSIHTIELKTGKKTLVVANGNAPAWSPNGDWIAFERDGDIWKAKVDKGGNPIGDPIQMTSSPFFEARPTWSNNNKTIAFHAGMGNDTDIWMVPASGGTETWLNGAPGFGDYDPNYSPNGRYISYSSFSPDGQAARTWIADFSYDAGTWTEGEHSYSFENTYSLPEPWSGTSDPITFNVTTDAHEYNGYALLRTFGLRARVGSDCPAIDPLLHPDQNTRFGYGWQTDFPMTYAEALEHFNSMTVKAYWDDGMSADLQRHEIFPSSSVDFGEIVCASTEAPPVPTFVAYLPYAIEGYDWPMGDEIKISINGSDFPVTAFSEQRPDSPEGSTRVHFDVGSEGITLTTDDHIVMTDLANGITKDVTVTNLAVTDFDLSTGKVFGTYDPAYALWVWLYDLDGQVPEADSANGTWVATFAELPLGALGGATQWDWDGDGTSIDFQVPNTRFTVWPEQNYLEGYEWPDGALVSISVDGKEVCSTEATSAFPEEDSSTTFFSVNFPDGCNIEVGDLITLSYESLSLTHQVQALAITEVNLDNSTVAGTAIFDPEKYILHTWVHGVDGSYMQLSTEGGAWLADFSFLEGGLQPGMGGRVELVDQSSNATAVEWTTPPAMGLRVNYGHDWVESFYEDEHAVSIQVTDSEGNVKATAEAVTEPKDYWGGETGFQTLDGVWFDGDGNLMENPPDIQPYDWVYALVDNGVNAQVQLGDIQGEVNFQTDSVSGTITADWLSEPVSVECLDWGSGGEPINKDAGFVYPDGTNSYSCSWDPETEWDVQPWQDIGVGYSTPDGHWVANAFHDERWMAFWTYTPDPSTGFFPEGEHSYSYEWAYTAPEPDSGTSGPLTITIAEAIDGNSTPIYDGFALIGPWGLDYPGKFRPQLAWTGSACEEVSVLHPDQQMQFVWGWVNDYSMTYEEALAHFESLTIDVLWDLFSDGNTDGSATLSTMTELLPFTGRDARFENLCTLTGHP